MNQQLFRDILQSLSNSRPFTKEEAESVRKLYEERSVVVECLYPDVLHEVPPSDSIILAKRRP